MRLIEGTPIFGSRDLVWFVDCWDRFTVLIVFWFVGLDLRHFDCRSPWRCCCRRRRSRLLCRWWWFFILFLAWTVFGSELEDCLQFLAEWHDDWIEKEKENKKRILWWRPACEMSVNYRTVSRSKHAVIEWMEVMFVDPELRWVSFSSIAWTSSLFISLSFWSKQISPNGQSYRRQFSIEKMRENDLDPKTRNQIEIISLLSFLPSFLCTALAVISSLKAQTEVSKGKRKKRREEEEEIRERPNCIRSKPSIIIKSSNFAMYIQ